MKIPVACNRITCTSWERQKSIILSCYIPSGHFMWPFVRHKGEPRVKFYCPFFIWRWDCLITAPLSSHLVFSIDHVVLFGEGAGANILARFAVSFNSPHSTKRGTKQLPLKSVYVNNGRKPLLHHPHSLWSVHGIAPRSKLSACEDSHNFEDAINLTNLQPFLPPYADLYGKAKSKVVLVFRCLRFTLCSSRVQGQIQISVFVVSKKSSQGIDERGKCNLRPPSSIFQATIITFLHWRERGYGNVRIDYRFWRALPTEARRPFGRLFSKRI